MEAFIFVLVVNLNPLFDQLNYVGHFKSCSHANLYVELHYPDVQESRCLLEEYIVIPKDVKKRIIDVHDGCKLKRTCNGA